MDPVKQLSEQHNQLRRLFKQVPRLEPHQSVDKRAFAICDLMTIHSRLEEEILYPFVRDIDAALADQAEAAHRKAESLITSILEVEYENDRQIKEDLDVLGRAFVTHARWEEDNVLRFVSALATEDFNRIGRALYERHQGLLREYPDAMGASSESEGYSAGPLI